MNLPNLPDHLACPTLLLAHPDPCFAAQTRHAFRQLGWNVYTAQTAAEVRRLTQKLSPTAVVLSVELEEESGWLTCDKLLRQQPDLPVFLVGPQPTGRNGRFARFVGAVALLDEEADVAGLVEESLGLMAMA